MAAPAASTAPAPPYVTVNDVTYYPAAHPQTQLQTTALTAQPAPSATIGDQVVVYFFLTLVSVIVVSALTCWLVAALKRAYAATFSTAALLDYSSGYPDYPVKCVLTVNRWDRRRYHLVHQPWASSTDRDRYTTAFMRTPVFLMVVTPWLQRSINYKDLGDLDQKKFNLSRVSEYGLRAKARADLGR